MEDLSFLVKQTLKNHTQDWVDEDEEGWEPEVEISPAPVKPGLFFHVDYLGGTFVIRSLVSDNLAQDLIKIKSAPEDFPSLRLIHEGKVKWHKLSFFPCEFKEEAEVLHQRLGMRRFPVKEENVCNLSDPGFSFWFEKTPQGFALHPKIKNLAKNSMRIGPILDSRIAQRRWSELSQVFSEIPLEIDFSQENGSLCFQSQEEWLTHSIESVFTKGEFPAELTDIFKLLAKKMKQTSLLETTWFFLQEAAVARKFWIKVESELNYWS